MSRLELAQVNQLPFQEAEDSTLHPLHEQLILQLWPNTNMITTRRGDRIRLSSYKSILGPIEQMRNKKLKFIPL